MYFLHSSYYMSQKVPLSEIVKQVARQLTGKLDEEVDELLPEYNIKGTGYLYCWSISDRLFSKVYRGTGAFLIAENYDEMGRSLIYTYSNDIVLIDPDELQYIGYD